MSMKFGKIFLGTTLYRTTFRRNSRGVLVAGAYVKEAEPGYPILGFGPTRYACSRDLRQSYRDLLDMIDDCSE